jgi:TonB family protein
MIAAMKLTALRNSLRIVLAFGCLSLGTQAQPPASPVSRHQGVFRHALNSSCDLIQPASLQQYENYFALVLKEEEDTLYSPELGASDFVYLSANVSPQFLKSARRAGFMIRTVADLSDIQISTMEGKGCPSLENAMTEARLQRLERRSAIQSRVYTIGGDVEPPAPTRQVQPTLPTVSKQAKSSLKVPGDDVVVSGVLGVDGTVHDAVIVQRVEPAFDEKALETVRQWAFVPARKRGLPVAIKIAIAVKFR